MLVGPIVSIKAGPNQVVKSNLVCFSSAPANAILAREKSERLEGRVDADLLARAAPFLIEPGIRVA
jgi:hypothetical protein